MKQLHTALALAVFALIGLSGCTATTAKHEATITVDDKDRVCESANSSCRYLIYTTEGDVFENTDAIIWGEGFKYNSSDVQAELRVGHTYRIKAVGYRYPPLSLYPNIYSVQEAK